MKRDEVIGSVIREMEGESRFGCCELPDRKRIVDIISDIQAFMFPAFCEESVSGRMLLERIRWELARQIRRALKFDGRVTLDPEEAADKFVLEIPNIYRLLKKDIEAIYEGDPAAASREEVIVAYPGFFAILVYRIAHVLYEMRVPILPRIMTEFVHQKTGIDIHAGAKSFELDENGNPVKGIKRHPNIGNHVVIYANATILGGDTTVGDHCVIGGNVWLTASVPAGKTVVYKG